MTTDAATRAGAGRLVSGVVWNALGRGLPLLIALLLTPVLLRLMGVERWGLFTLALAMVGVMGVLDLGVGPALTRTLSTRMHENTAEQQAALVRAGMAALGGASVLATAALWFAVPAIVTHALNVPEALRAEASAAIRVLALAIPLVVVNAALWGVLAAYQRFASANLVTVPVNLMYYLGPVLTLLVWDDLSGVMWALVACRAVNTFSYLWLVRRDLPTLWHGLPRMRLAAPLLKLGGWITFASVTGQALLYADRFLIGALVTLTAVAYYATPLDLVMRLWILPVAVSQALLPAMSSAYATLPETTAALLRRGGLLILLLVFPAAAILAGAGHEVLWLWLGREMADGGGAVLAVLAVGGLFSCFAYAPNALLEAMGRPDVTARFVLVQVAVFLPLSAGALLLAGIQGAALAWALRVVVDALGKLFFVAWLYPKSARAVRALIAPLAVAGMTLALLTSIGGWLEKAIVLAVGGVALLVLCWRALEPEERMALRNPRGWRGLMRA
ncbi:flippase [Rhodovarius lipocyclicus]|uniref:flippase n=1 Tax=Rhodovarius lipocyclicus TaxID=268410 RepID=UPI0013571DB2|nr:flippase [Rhodovarius lipocyclicus]